MQIYIAQNTDVSVIPIMSGVFNLESEKSCFSWISPTIIAAAVAIKYPIPLNTLLKYIKLFKADTIPSIVKIIIMQIIQFFDFLGRINAKKMIEIVLETAGAKRIVTSAS